MHNAILPNFQGFLLSRKLARPNQAPYFASWVNKFLSFTPSTPVLSQEAKIKQFLEQADTAIRLYLFHFIHKNTNPIGIPEAAADLTTPHMLLARMIEILSLTLNWRISRTLFAPNGAPSSPWS
jgi:hypothetical protein